MPLFDLVGQDLEKAETLLTRNSVDFIKKITTPPWPGEGQGKLRVIRQKLIDQNRWELVVAYDSYVRIK